MAVRNHHHLPAAVIGRFGGPHPEGLRYALIAVRQKKRKAKAQLSTAETIAGEPDLYRPSELPAGVDPEHMERLWERIERPLVDSLCRLEAGGHDGDDQDLVFSYLAALGVRRPGAVEKVARPRWGTVRHEDGPDQLRLSRLLVLRNTLSMIRSLRWRILEAPPDAPRYVVNDLGFTTISESGRRGEALFVPVGPRLALLGFQHRPTDLHERLYPAPWTVRWLNAATWTQETAKAVFGHPDDLEMLMELKRVRRVKKSPWGPFRDRQHTLMGD